MSLVPGRNHTGTDPLVCRVEDIVPFLTAYIKAQEGERDPRGREALPTGSTYAFISERQVLADEAGVSIRTVGRILGREQKWVGYGLAESLLVTGMGRPDLLQHLRFVPNPLWTREAWSRWKSSCETD